MVQSYVIAASTPGTVLRYAAAFFLVVVAIGLVVALIRLAQTLKRVDKLVEDTDREMIPLLTRSQVTLDQVNSELGKVDEILASAVNVTNKVDATTNVVQTAVTAPAKKAAAFSAGVSQAVASFFARHDDEGPARTRGEQAGTQGPSWATGWSQSGGTQAGAADGAATGGASPVTDEPAAAATTSWEGQATPSSPSAGGVSDSTVAATGSEGEALSDASAEETRPT